MGFMGGNILGIVWDKNIWRFPEIGGFSRINLPFLGYPHLWKCPNVRWTTSTILIYLCESNYLPTHLSPIGLFHLDLARGPGGILICYPALSIVSPLVMSPFLWPKLWNGGNNR